MIDIDGYKFTCTKFSVLGLFKSVYTSQDVLSINIGNHWPPFYDRRNMESELSNALKNISDCKAPNSKSCLLHGDNPECNWDILDEMHV